MEHNNRGSVFVFYTLKQLAFESKDQVVVGFESLSTFTNNKNSCDDDVVSLIKSYDPSKEFVLYVTAQNPENPKNLLYRYYKVSKDMVDKTPKIPKEDIPAVVTYRGVLTQIPREEKIAYCFNDECELYGLKTCSVCKKAKYCSVKCQREHWKKHKKMCKKEDLLSKK